MRSIIDADTSDGAALVAVGADGRCGEECLYTHPAIRDVRVVGVPDERYGEEIAAFVIAREPGTIDTEAVREFCHGKIAHYKIPRYVISWTSSR